MRKQFTSLAMFFALCGSAFGQTAYLEDILIQNCKVEKTDARRVRVSMNIDLSGLNIHHQHSLRLVPVIVSADGMQKQELAPLIVDGKIRYRIHSRVERLEDITLYPNAVAHVNRHNGTTQQVGYEADTAFRRWMIGSELQLRAYVTGCASCEEGNETNHTGDILPPMNPVYACPFMQPVAETVKRRSETRSARIQFRQNSADILPEYKNNRTELDSVHHSVSLVKDNRDVSITGIYVTGYASPEGSFDYNMKLSERRAKAFTDYMKKKFEGIDPSLYHIAWKGEDWDGLRAEVLKHPHLLDIDKVLDIIDHCGDDKDDCERQIKALASPDIYQRLLNEMYGPIRRNEYRIEYNVRHFTVAEGRDIIKTRPDLMSVSEIQQVADSYGKGSSEYLACMEAGAKAWPQNVTMQNNAALALMDAGRIDDAIALLEKAPEDGTLLNVLGVAYARQEKFEKAVKAFQNAQAKGNELSEENLKLIDRYMKYMAE